MIYIVTGDGPRCGSTMMMHALSRGGMKIGWSKSLENVLEINLDMQHAPGFPDETYTDMAIKFFGGYWGRLDSIVPGDYKVVWLHRSPEERWASFHKSENDPEMVRWMGGDKVKGREAQIYRDNKCRDSLSILRIRPDIEVTELNYRDICKDPLKAFGILRKKGWPLDTKKAASEVRT